MLFQHQRAVHAEILRTVKTYFEANWQDLPVRPRFNRFITGPTGTGKTTLVRSVAQELKLPVFELSASSWIPIGATERGARPTWLDIAHFCLTQKEGIIFLDETDKLGEQSSWMNHLRVEIFSLLDQKVPQQLLIKSTDGEDESDEEYECALRRHTVEERLRNQMVIVGAGAFQSLFETRGQSSCGFHAKPVTADCALAPHEMHQIIPPEIANRFAGPILQLNPLKESDYREMAGRVRESLPPHLAKPFARLSDQRIETAVKNQSGCRWIEELLLAALNGDGTYQAESISPTSPAKASSMGRKLTEPTPGCELVI